MVAKLNFGPIVAGYGVEQGDDTIPAKFHETLAMSMPFGDRNFIGGYKTAFLGFSPFHIFFGRFTSRGIVNWNERTRLVVIGRLQGNSEVQPQQEQENENERKSEAGHQRKYLRIEWENGYGKQMLVEMLSPSN